MSPPLALTIANELALLPISSINFTAANSPQSSKLSCSIKIIEYMRKDAAEQIVSEQEALRNRMEE